MTLDPEVTKSLNELLVTVITTVVLPAIVYAGLLFRTYVKAKVAAINDANVRKAVEFAIDRFDATAYTVVTDINQRLKKATAEGKLTREQAQYLIKTAYTNLLIQLPRDVTATLKQVYGEDNFQKVVRSKLESKVAEAKAACR